MCEPVQIRQRVRIEHDVPKVDPNRIFRSCALTHNSHPERARMTLLQRPSLNDSQLGKLGLAAHRNVLQRSHSGHHLRSLVLERFVGNQEVRKLVGEDIYKELLLPRGSILDLKSDPLDELRSLLNSRQIPPVVMDQGQRAVRREQCVHTQNAHKQEGFAQDLLTDRWIKPRHQIRHW